MIREKQAVSGLDQEKERLDFDPRQAEVLQQLLDRKAVSESGEEGNGCNTC